MATNSSPPKPDNRLLRQEGSEDGEPQVIIDLNEAGGHWLSPPKSRTDRKLHMGPGLHPSGSSQEVHGHPGEGGAADMPALWPKEIQRRQALLDRLDAHGIAVSAPRGTRFIRWLGGFGDLTDEQLVGEYRRFEQEHPERRRPVSERLQIVGNLSQIDANAVLDWTDRDISQFDDAGLRAVIEAWRSSTPGRAHSPTPLSLAATIAQQWGHPSRSSGEEAVLATGKFALSTASPKIEMDDLLRVNRGELFVQEGDTIYRTNLAKEMNDSLKPFGVTVEDLVDAYTPNRGDDSFGVNLDLKVSSDGTYVTVKGTGTIKGEGDKRHNFSFNRTLHLDKKEVYHGHFVIDREGQNRGVGSLFAVSADNLYRKLGITQVRLAAISDVGEKVTGHQMWAIQGYDWRDDDIATTIREAFSSAIRRRYGPTSVEYQQTEAMLRNQAKPWEYARFKDQKGERIGFDLMHLAQLNRVNSAVPFSVAMVRYLDPKSKSDQAWQAHVDHVKGKEGAK